MGRAKAHILHVMAKIWRTAYTPPHPRKVILCYHSVHPTCSFKSCTPATFEEHLQWLQANCDVVSLQRLQNLGAESGHRRRPLVALTFDDGYRDNYDYAFPLLMKWRIPATFFVTVGLIEHDPSVMRRFQHLRQTDMHELAPLTWAHVREMNAAGMEFGAHTYSHPNLMYVRPSQYVSEFQEARARLEDQLGHTVSGFAYPFGQPRCHFTTEHVELVRQFGYAYAVTVVWRGVGTGDARWTLPRFSVRNDDVRTLTDKVNGGWDVVGHMHERLPSWVNRVIAPGAFRASTYTPP